ALRSGEGMYVNTSSMSMKSKNDALPLSVSDTNNMLSISPYVFDSPVTPCPPTPYWGSYGVSAPPSSRATTTTSNPLPQSHDQNAIPNMNLGRSSHSQAP